MGNNLRLRLISSLLTGAMTIWIIFAGGFWLYVEIAICLCGLLIEWSKINHTKKTALFVGGVTYITAPMIFWLWSAIYRQEAMIRSILWILTIVCSCDIFAFFGGKLLKGPKFAPKISPNKTWSGVFIGGVFAFLASIIYIFFSEWPSETNFAKIIMSVIIIIAAVLGDLLESKVKRILGVKDTGKIIPGHGGICDRLDSFLLASNVFIILDYSLKMGFIFG
jgi:phosphatidate cytidylyltransferase